MAAEAQEFRASLLTIPLEVRHMIICRFQILIVFFSIASGAITAFQLSTVTPKYETYFDATQYILIQEARELSPCQQKILWPAQSAAGSYNFRYEFPTPNHCPFESLTLYRLRSTNKQLYEETLDFVTLPKLCLRVVDWFRSLTVVFSATQRLTSDGFARENTVTI